MALIRTLNVAYVIALLMISVSAQADFFGNKKEEKFTASTLTLEHLIPLTVSPTYNIVKVSTDDQIEVYRKLLVHVKSEELTSQILIRLADLEMMLQEQKVARSEQLAEETGSSEEIYVADYTVAIDAYKTALQRYPEGATNDAVLYQLAKVYDLSGQGQHNLGTLTLLVNQFPDSDYYTESQFRRGDMLFSNRRYASALEAYQSVLDAGQLTAYYENALYMHGWASFKLEAYKPAYASFIQVLDLSIPSSGDINAVSKTKISLVNDSFRILSIMFSLEKGADTIAGLLDGEEARSYEWRLYKNLGELYAKQERYQDAVHTYRAYIKRDPFSVTAPMLQNEVIKTLRIAKLYNQVFPEKEYFIEQYRVGGEYYEQAELDVRQYVSKYAYVYLEEAGRFYHARAQEVRRRYKVTPPKYIKKMTDDYRRAIELYQRYQDSYLDDEHNAEKSFMQAEAYIALGEYRSAITAYEKVAYDYPINIYSEQAAYSAILAYRKLVKLEPSEEKRQYFLKEKLNMQLSFGEIYSFSQFARAILLDSIDLLYTQKSYQLAIDQSDIFLSLEPKGSAKELLTIWTVKAHGNFKLENYAKSELDYKQTLEFLSKKDKRYWIMNDQMAASVYKQGEALAAEGKLLEAVEQLVRVASIAPESKHRKSADYDAATYLLQAEEWERAITLVNLYRKRYDPKKSDLDITGKLIFAYEKLDRHNDAAAELKRVYRDEKDPDKRRQALFLAAEYYDKADNNKKALDTFKQYAHAYPQPFDLAIETKFRLSQMYKKVNDDNRMRYWLEKIIIADRDAGDQRTTRSKFLAAHSRNVFANDKFKLYEDIELTWPIGKSLAKKRESMDDLLRRYQQIMAYEVQEFSTQSQYNVAMVYALLASGLLVSEHPPGMGELEAEEYEYLLEDEALPFEDQAIEIHEANVKNSWNGNYDVWVGKSMSALGKLLPGRYNKKEVAGTYSDAIY